MKIYVGFSKWVNRDTYVTHDIVESVSTDFSQVQFALSPERSGIVGSECTYVEVWENGIFKERLWEG